MDIKVKKVLFFLNLIIITAVLNVSGAEVVEQLGQCEGPVPFNKNIAKAILENIEQTILNERKAAGEGEEVLSNLLDKAYRRACLIYSPDKDHTFGSDDRFLLLKQAYEDLKLKRNPLCTSS